MIAKILFLVISISMFIILIFTGFKAVLLMVSIANKTGQRSFQYKDLHLLSAKANKKDVKKDIGLYLKYKEIGLLSLAVGFGLLLMISVINGFLNS